LIHLQENFLAVHEHLLYTEESLCGNRDTPAVPGDRGHRLFNFYSKGGPDAAPRHRKSPRRSPGQDRLWHHHESVFSVIVNRLGKEALALTAEDLQLARGEIKAVFGDYLDVWDYIDLGVDV